MGLRQFKTPDWLDDTAKEHWKRLYPAVKSDLTDRNIDAFAVLCDAYSQYRQATTIQHKKIAFDHYYKLLKEFRLTPKAFGAKPEPKQDDLTAFLTDDS